MAAASAPQAVAGNRARSPLSVRGSGVSALRLVPASSTSHAVSRDSTVADPVETSRILGSLGAGMPTAIVVESPRTSRDGMTDGWGTNRSLCPGMTLRSRVLGWFVCFVIGCSCSASAMQQLGEVFEGRPMMFGTMYSAGNLVSLCGTTFMVGPHSQLRSMTDPKRISSALVYLGAVAATLVSALLLRNSSATLAFLVVQFLAMWYYTLSYIPGGQWCGKHCVKVVLGL